MPGVAMPRNPSLIEPFGKSLELGTTQFFASRVSTGWRQPHRLFEPGHSFAQRRMCVARFGVAGKELIEHFGRGRPGVPRQHLRVWPWRLGVRFMTDVDRRPMRAILESRP